MNRISIPGSVPLRYIERGGALGRILGAMVLIGAATFFVTLAGDPALAWKSYVVNWSFFTSIALGGVMVAVVTWIVKARWNWSVRRIHHSCAAFLPIAFVLFLPMLFNLREDYFPWIEMMAHDPIVQKKAAYLNVPFLVSRNLVGVLALFTLALGFVYLAVRPDLGRAALAEAGLTPNPVRSRWRERLTRGWAGQETEEERSYEKMTRMAPLIVLVYAVVMTVLVFDWAMSLEPHWFSSLFGGWYFMGAIWGGFAVTAVVGVHLRRRDSAFQEHFDSAARWDLGKLVFAFTVFWTYLFWSQYIVIWYGKLPWEQAWLSTRLSEPWGALSATVVVLCFVVPFFGLLGVRPKKTPWLLQGLARVVLIGIWLWHYMLIFPSLHHDGDAVFSWATPLMGLGFLGLFLISVRWFLATFPAIQIWQPPVDPEPLEAEGQTAVTAS